MLQHSTWRARISWTLRLVGNVRSLAPLLLAFLCRCLPLLLTLPTLLHAAVAIAAFASAKVGCAAWIDAHPHLSFCTVRPNVVPQLPLLSPEPAALQHALALGPEPQQEVECRMFLSLCQVAIGIVAPTLLLAKMQIPVHAAAATAAAEAGAEQRRGRSRLGGRSGSVQERRRHSGDSPVKRVSRLCLRLVRSAADEADAFLWHLCQLLTNRAGSLIVTSLAWWLLLSAIWVTVLLLELPHLALSMC